LNANRGVKSLVGGSPKYSAACKKIQERVICKLWTSSDLPAFRVRRVPPVVRIGMTIGISQNSILTPSTIWRWESDKTERNLAAVPPKSSFLIARLFLQQSKLFFVNERVLCIGESKSLLDDLSIEESTIV